MKLKSSEQEEQTTYEGISTHFHAFGFSDLFIDVTDDENFRFANASRPNTFEGNQGQSRSASFLSATEDNQETAHHCS